MILWMFVFIKMTEDVYMTMLLSSSLPESNIKRKCAHYTNFLFVKNCRQCINNQEVEVTN